jgi:peptidoglycan hydrolase-like protein with peptidoglycan-binding domain
MLSGRVKLQLIAFFALSTGVAGNLFLLQPDVRASRDSQSGRQVAAVHGASIGDTGSIERSSLEPVRIAGAGVANSATMDLPRDAGDVTRAIQRELDVRGYETGGVDGIAGTLTRAAILGFEYDHGMVLTGQPSQDLLRRILLSANSRSTPIGSKGQSPEARDMILSVQTALAKLGYRPGALDGQLSAETMHAIREFEVDQALPESGRISGPLVARLARLASPGHIAAQ